MRSLVFVVRFLKNREHIRFTNEHFRAFDLVLFLQFGGEQKIDGSRDILGKLRKNLRSDIFGGGLGWVVDESHDLRFQFLPCFSEQAGDGIDRDHLGHVEVEFFLQGLSGNEVDSSGERPRNDRNEFLALANDETLDDSEHVSTSLLVMNERD